MLMMVPILFTSIKSDTHYRVTRRNGKKPLVDLYFGMFHHPAMAVGSYSVGPPAAEIVRNKSTGGFFTILTGHPLRTQNTGNTLLKIVQEETENAQLFLTLSSNT